MTRSQQRQGEEGEQAAERELMRLGVCNLAKVATPIGIARRGTGRFAGWVKIFYKQNVLGDRRGELENGISVLVEVKTTRGKDRLTWSCFTSPHQPKALDNHKGLSLLVWVCDTDWARDIYVMGWLELKRYGFRKGKGIGKDDAEKLSMKEDDFDFLAGVTNKNQRVHVSMDTVSPF